MNYSDISCGQLRSGIVRNNARVVPLLDLPEEYVRNDIRREVQRLGDAVEVLSDDNSTEDRWNVEKFTRR
jgi:hypothetical protein